MRKRLKEIEDEAGALREMQAKVEKEMGLQGIFTHCSSLGHLHFVAELYLGFVLWLNYLFVFLT